MALWSAFVGGAYTDRSLSIQVDRAINVFTQTRQIPGSPKQGTLYGTPGQKTQTTLSGTNGRGWFSQDGRTFTVDGTSLFEQVNATTYTNLGTIPDDGKMCSFATNGEGGNQLGIVGAGVLTVLDLSTNTLSTPVLPFAGPVQMTFQDGYGLINQANSPIVWFSALEDFTSWDALDFFTRSDTSDNCIGISASQDRIWFFGSKRTNFFYDSGDADTPFIPYQGTIAQNGLAAPMLFASYRDNYVWVSSAVNGNYQVLSGTSPQAQPISIHQIETWLAGCTTLTDAWMFCYEQDGHVFYGITCPSSPDEIKTYVYDATEQNAPWHARANWDPVTGKYTLWRVRGTVNVNGQVFAGDYANGNIYTLDLETYTDNGGILRRERRAPYIGADNQVVFVDQFELGTQAGVGLSSGQGSDPMATLEVSYDNAHTFQSAGDSPLGMQGDYEDARTIWTQLGSGRQDRLVLKVTQTDPVPCVWGPGAFLRLEQGTGQR